MLRRAAALAARGAGAARPEGGARGRGHASSAADGGGAAAEQAAEAAWEKWMALENQQLNWVRNGLATSGLGMSFVHFRRASNDADECMENDTPPLGGFALMALGMGILTTGSAQHVLGAYVMRRALRLTPLGAAAVLGHAAAPLLFWGVGILCVADVHPRWLCELVDVNRRALPDMLVGKRLDNLLRIRGVEPRASGAGAAR
eukprot:PRCOL_00000562-RA